MLHSSDIAIIASAILVLAAGTFTANTLFFIGGLVFLFAVLLKIYEFNKEENVQ